MHAFGGRGDFQDANEMRECLGLSMEIERDIRQATRTARQVATVTGG